VSSIELQILNERYIGRYFQAAALGIALDSLPPHFSEKIIRGFEEGLVALSRDEAKKLLEVITEKLRNLCKECKTREKGSNLLPTLYKAGAYYDGTILERAFNSDIRDVSCDSVIGIGDSLKLNNLNNITEKLPMILKTYVFSEYRDRYSVESVNSLSLYVTVAGIPISIIAQGGKGKSRKDEGKYELYVVPDTSAESLRASGKLYQLLHLSVEGRCISDYINDVSKIEGLSFELATLIAVAIYIYQAMRLASEIPSINALYDVFEMFRLVNIRPERRPQVVWERPLTITHIFRGLDDVGALELLDTLKDAIEHSNKLGGDARRLREEVRDVVSRCVTALFTYFETWSLDPLLACGADSVKVARRLGELGMSGASRTFTRLVRHISRLASPAWLT